MQEIPTAPTGVNLNSVAEQCSSREAAEVRLFAMPELLRCRHDCLREHKEEAKAHRLPVHHTPPMKRVEPRLRTGLEVCPPTGSVEPGFPG